MRSPAASTTVGSASIVAGVVSRLRPPWLETITPASPSAAARRASSGARIPLISTGVFANERIQATVSHVTVESIASA